MAEEQQEIPQEKKREYKTIYLFGNKISVPCSSLESNETAMPLANVPISPTKEADEDLKKTHKEDSVPVDLSLAISRNPNLDSKVTCAGRNKDSTEYDRKTKKMRSLPKEEREEEEQTGPWTITKALFMSDINSNCRLTVEKEDAERHIIRHLSADAQKKIQQGIGVEVKVYDDDENTEHDLVFKRLVDSSKSYIFNGGWTKQFVERRELKVGDTIGLFWGNVDSRLHFSVRQRENISS
ncbi:putative B3 domain-containing protein [Cardamine amara subsp. amara]|uniref:B3 domain-containing protein n=1 Tax=Cardamine amara subsp. amara TaxID=228776 RepID=A0ABD1A7C6_CARAN